MKKKTFTVLLSVLFVLGACGSAAAAEAAETAESRSFGGFIEQILQEFIGETAGAPQVQLPQEPAAEPAEQVIRMVNRERAAEGLSALASDRTLNRLARLKAEDMAEHTYFSHTSPSYGTAFDLLQKEGISYRTAGENIARGQKTAEAVMQGWMNSSGHRANILAGGYTRIGAGYAADENGTTYWVQIFAG